MLALLPAPGVGFGVWGFGFGIWGLGFPVLGFRLRSKCFGFRVPDSGVWVRIEGHRVNGSNAPPCIYHARRRSRTPGFEFWSLRRGYRDGGLQRNSQQPPLWRRSRPAPSRHTQGAQPWSELTVHGFGIGVSGSRISGVAPRQSQTPLASITPIAD